jgi:DNA mismatch repair ATPase MutS
MLITLDELFKSTHHEKGQLIAQRLLEKLYESPQVMVLVSTHFEKLIELARTSNGMCANYTINNFILEPGTGSSEKSFDIVRSHAKSRLL